MLAAQTIVGCLVARAITGDIVVAFLKDWPLLVGVVLIIIATSGLLGWTMARFKVLPEQPPYGEPPPARPRP